MHRARVVSRGRIRHQRSRLRGWLQMWDASLFRAEIIHRDRNVWVQPDPRCLEYNPNCFGVVDGMPARLSTQTQCVSIEPELVLARTEVCGASALLSWVPSDCCRIGIRPTRLPVYHINVRINWNWMHTSMQAWNMYMRIFQNRPECLIQQREWTNLPVWYRQVAHGEEIHDEHPLNKQ